MQEKRIIVTKSELDHLRTLPYLGEGEQGAVYRWDNQALKLFNPPKKKSLKKDIQKYMVFQQVDMDDFSFPRQLLFCEDQFVGYTMALFKGLDLSCQPFKGSFDDLKSIVLYNQKNIIDLSSQKIIAWDMDVQNAMYCEDENKIKFMDTDYYMYDAGLSIDECLENNNNIFNFLYVNMLNDGLDAYSKYNNPIFSQIGSRLNRGIITPVEYIDILHSRIENVVGHEIETLEEGAKVLKKL